ncbi:MAG: HNH endonuclease signature motif containing protein [Cutibacterium avidum]|nr:HNH endonuclease signature motif containing protein [Cutibacterium avidum]MDU5420291.1 HNH endonuclease signature motif containing protein [Cutibacterium avidum]
MSWGGRKVAALRAAVVATYGAVCVHCGEVIDLTVPSTSPMGLSVEHLRPRSQGGTDDLTNLRPSHLRCNTARQARPIGAIRRAEGRPDWAARPGRAG